MAQHLGDDLGVNITRQKQCRAGVPQIMESDGREPGLLKQRRVISLPEIGGIYERTLFRGENKALVFVEVTEVLYPIYLVGEVVFESLHCRVSESYRPAATLCLDFTKE